MKHYVVNSVRGISTFMGLVAVLCFAIPELVHGQDLEPRRWSHLPVGANYAGVGYAYTDGEILFDPVVRLEDVEMRLQSYPAKYIYSFGLLGKSARVEVLGTYQEGDWDGLLDGEPREASRSGWADPSARFAVNFIGAPPLSGQEFAAYRASVSNETIIGAAVTLQAPLGEYNPDKLINLGQNRYVIRPQMGGVRSWGRFSTELDISMFIYTDNDDFYIDQTREQDPLFLYAAHLTYTFMPGVWVGLSGGYGVGGDSTIGGVDKDDRQENVSYAAAIGLPINRSAGVKIGYLGIRTRTDLGTDSDTLATAVSYLW